MRIKRTGPDLIIKKVQLGILVARTHTRRRSWEKVKPLIWAASPSATCDGGLESSSFLSFSWSWSRLCLGGAGWLAVGCDWAVTGSPADAWQSAFASLGWSASLGLAGCSGHSR